MTFKSKIYISFYILLSFFTINSFAQNYVKKQGGVSFRVDDNSYVYQYRDYANVFNKYNFKYNFAMNLANPEFNAIGYSDSIKVFQDMGHLLMDHTPSHSTAFINTTDTNLFSGITGVDHIINNKVCLSHENTDTLLAAFSGFADVKADTIFFNSDDYHELTHWQGLGGNGRYIYFPSKDTMVLVKEFDNGKEAALFTDIWNDPLSLTDTTNIKFFTFKKDQISITPEALTLLITETKNIALNYGLTPPNVWIQPGGNNPWFRSENIKTVYENLGIVGAATYPNKAYKVYNEYNPNNDRQYAFQWGDFFEETESLDRVKLKIADGIAKHKVMINTVHWYSNNMVGDMTWQEYILKMDSLLTWLDTNNVPVITYDNWIDTLYNQTADPYENVIPPLNVDIDKNDIPDGYTNVLYPDNSLTGVLTDDSTAIDSTAYYSIYVDDYKKITNILDMGGIEKGANDFSIYTKGSPGNSVRVKFSEVWPGTYSREFEFPAESSEWRKYDLAQSINGNTTFDFPDTLSRINIDFFHRSTNQDTMWISGMYLAKKTSYDSLKLNVLNTNPILAGDSIFVEVELKDEFGNPAITSYNYSIDFPDTSSAELLTQGNLYFNNTSKDTVIVRDTTSGIINLSLTLNDISLIGNIDIPILPNLPYKLINLTTVDTTQIDSQILLHASLVDTFNNPIPDSLITFSTLNGNGKFVNELQTIDSLTNINGIVSVIYNTSTLVGVDSIEIKHGSNLLDTLTISIIPGAIKNLDIQVNSNLPVYDNQNIKLQINAFDKFNNSVFSNSSYTIDIIGSSTAEVLPSLHESFSNSNVDTINISDKYAGLFKVTVTLDDDTTVTDTTELEVIYSEKVVYLKFFLEGPYNIQNHKMNSELNSNIPLSSPYIEAPDTAETIPSSIVDWVLVTLRKDVNPLEPDPSTSEEVVSKSALVNIHGEVINSDHSLLKFKAAEEEYYIQVKHRNHLPIMSSGKILLSTP